MRYLIGEVARVVDRFAGWAAVLIANLLGCLILGVVAGLEAPGGTSETTGILLVGVGFCGALTTMSSLALDLTILHGERRLGAAALLLSGSWAGGLAMIQAGRWMGAGW